MNQALQFPDREEWDEVRQAVCFPALYQGMQLHCAITAADLRHRFGEGQPLKLFRQHRWDIEDDMESRIIAGTDDDYGWFWLSSDR
ncbi:MULTISPECIES: DUF1488 domain-containing protein [Tatumella]|uniref:DUF1488 domain-containing protein n=1 Tax=Tatumella punctata TaxID=399969 RepID=A0ABW1VQW2_9GAMM|nr:MULTISPECIES: DUF1488 domain-containing protein [unclassified Tatumella]MBS0857506.1 DUF1488 domain-containing protein [Tatumella sp. JGM16]MBS0878814.1 DUF1488 domain-containing protein [Tatumella sp. JGM82]MBS0892291.1 DUF1488 domain-containing protein [Tatumella sp. JGM94]MBS0895352.1 DUF1488 domain-containing protein [Tatumella sp. JGM130]MBS0903380.1 DUF1488 domain-containing protein [Tatumella sp. JGM100]